MDYSQKIGQNEEFVSIVGIVLSLYMCISTCTCYVCKADDNDDAMAIPHTVLWARWAKEVKTNLSIFFLVLQCTHLPGLVKSSKFLIRKVMV